MAIGCVIAPTVGCGPAADDSPEALDPWGAAGVSRPQITQQTTGGRTTVTVKAETDLPLEDRENQIGFGKRTAKIAWRSYAGRIDTLNTVTGQSGHPDRSYRRTWPRTSLETAFGPRLSGLDRGNQTEVRSVLRGSPNGPFRGREAETVAQAGTILRQLLQDTADKQLGVDVPIPGAGDREECLSDLQQEPTGKYKAGASIEVRLPRNTHPIGPLRQVAGQWSRLGLDVDIFHFFSGVEDGIATRLPNVGTVRIGERPDHPRTLLLSYATECHSP